MVTIVAIATAIAIGLDFFFDQNLLFLGEFRFRLNIQGHRISSLLLFVQFRLDRSTRKVTPGVFLEGINPFFPIPQDRQIVIGGVGFQSLHGNVVLVGCVIQSLVGFLVLHVNRVGDRFFLLGIKRGARQKLCVIRVAAGGAGASAAVPGRRIIMGRRHRPHKHPGNGSHTVRKGPRAGKGNRHGSGWIVAHCQVQVPHAPVAVSGGNHNVCGHQKTVAVAAAVVAAAAQ
mmetsp:Transcript_18682/g.52246  ORF Transcript_18682/g.52246 Transcript_18682/m.52246 type:complete len:230 (-) Transcript_18682:530-1219(-)